MQEPEYSSLALHSLCSSIRVITTGPNPATVEGTIFTADPITNFLVLHTSSPSSANAQSKDTPLPVQPGGYRFLQISNISSFQLLTLPNPAPDVPSLILDPSTLDQATLKQRLAATLNTLAKAESRRGPPGTTQQAQDLFDALSRQYPMSWMPSTGAMIFSDDYVIEKPYKVDNVKAGAGGSSHAQGLERVKKVVRMERDKLELRWSAREIEGKMGMGISKDKENRAVGVGGGVAVSPRKGG